MSGTDARLDRVLAGIARPAPADDGPEPDYEAMAEARRDPEADLERAEDMYEKGMGL